MTRSTHLPRLALLASLVAACGSPVETITPPPPPPAASLSGPGPFVVSNPVASGAAGAAANASSATGLVFYVSLPPGAQPEGSGVRIRVERSGEVVSAALHDGGLDPVAVPAVEGDTISLTLTQSGGTVSAYRFKVPGRKPPVIVRTQPVKNKRDVPLNIRIQVIFSEPIDAASLTPQDFVLRSGSTQVPGQLGFANPEHTTVEFTPAADLAGATEYELVLGPGIRDTDGTPLEAAASISFITTEAQPGALGFGSLTGVVRLNGSGYPADGNGMPPRQGADQWPVFIAISGPGQTVRYAWTEETGTFEFEGLVAGTWTLVFSGMHPWSGVFPMRLFADTLVKVTVLPNQTTIIPEMVPSTVAPFIIIAIEHCLWGFSSPPTLQDWGECDGEGPSWGGVDAAVEVRGIPGTATAGVRYSLFIPSNRWHVEVHGAPAGEYEVFLVPVNRMWRLLPWQSSPVRFRVDRGLAYLEFDYWYQR